jgi:hypothetical protein
LGSDHKRALAIAEVERENADRVILGPLPFSDIAELSSKPVRCR